MELGICYLSDLFVLYKWLYLRCKLCGVIPTVLKTSTSFLINKSCKCPHGSGAPSLCSGERREIDKGGSGLTTPICFMKKLWSKKADCALRVSQTLCHRRKTFSSLKGMHILHFFRSLPKWNCNILLVDINICFGVASFVYFCFVDCLVWLKFWLLLC